MYQEPTVKYHDDFTITWTRHSFRPHCIAATHLTGIALLHIRVTGCPFASIETNKNWFQNYLHVVEEDLPSHSPSSWVALHSSDSASSASIKTKMNGFQNYLVEEGLPLHISSSWVTLLCRDFDALASHCSTSLASIKTN